MTSERTWDAIVIGGGPAGSGAATYLAREGRRVLLLEREHFPREHIGESLLPGVLPYLDALGARELIENAGFERKEGQTFIWGTDRTPWELDFRELDVHPYAFFVHRAKFDDLLLKHAARSGVDVREGSTVTRVLFENGRAHGVSFRDEGGIERTESAKFVIDASGQSALVARGAGLRRPVRGLKNVAVWAYWKNAARLPGHQRQHIMTVSNASGWVWAIPLGNTMSVGVVTNGTTREARKSLGASGWYTKTVRETEGISELVAGAAQVGDVTGARDWSYRVRRFSGPGILLAGDAACFIDPILSTGVHLAMSAAFWSAACVHSALSEPKYETFFRGFYDEQYNTTYRELLAQVKAFYGAEGRQDSMYWTSKKILRVGNSVAPDRAFLFITAGLLRNAATEHPHDPLAQARVELGTANVQAPARPQHPASNPESAPRRRSRVISPPLVWRVGAQGQAQLVTLRAEGLKLSLVRHNPQAMHDRPRGTYFVLELCDGQRCPMALALVEERRAGATEVHPTAGRWSVSLQRYPIRPFDPYLESAVGRVLQSVVDGADDARTPMNAVKLRAAVRKALREPGKLPGEITLARSRDLKGGGVSQPPMTAVFDPPPGVDLERIYIVLEARVPPESSDLPILRTRFLDLWLHPERTHDGATLSLVPSVRALLDDLGAQLWTALAPCTNRDSAFERAEALLRAYVPPMERVRMVEAGRLGAMDERV